jgi:rhamnosyltransferase
MTNNPSVAVLLAAHNGIKWINELVDSIFQQKNVDVNIYISVDISNDGTYELCQSLADKNINVSVLPYGNYFGCAAKNFFHLIIEKNLSGYDYISFADQDDIWFEDKLIDAIDKLKSSNCDGFSSDIISYWSKFNKRKPLIKSQPQKKYDHWFESPGPGCSYVLSINSYNLFREFILNNKKFLGLINSHDKLIYAFYRYSGFKWIISAKAKMFYRQHENNEMGANSTIKSKWNRIKKIKNNWFKNEVINHYEIITNKKFNQFIKSEKLILNIFNLRRKKLHSLIIWFLLCIGYFKK